MAQNVNLHDLWRFMLQHCIFLREFALKRSAKKIACLLCTAWCLQGSKFALKSLHLVRGRGEDTSGLWWGECLFIWA
ncbi:hypothetical protein A4G19_08495 [Pasteurellaceae bacterium Macca]|nr:hypothetical protein [Pasteurellaceae bacterium Macca]